MIAALLLACARPAPTPEASPFVALDAPALARRLSLDLRGALPEIDELERVEADPDALDDLIEAWLADPRHEERLVEVFGEQWLTQVDEYNVPPADFGLADAQTYAFQRAVGQEPLRLLARVATEDVPYSEIVTREGTMANALLLEIFPLELLDPGDQATVDAGGWAPARYTDGRPAGGVVMSNGLWWRHESTLNNLNRGRAAALSRHLLCADFLERPLVFEGIEDFSTEGMLEATRENPSCTSCHSGLDPLAANLFGFWWFDNKDAHEMARYHPSREPLGESYLDLDPTFFGTPVPGPAYLGEVLSEDPRFWTCAVERAAAALWRRDPTEEDYQTLDGVRAALEAEGGRFSALERLLVATDEYRAGALAEGADEDRWAEARTTRLMSVEQLRSAVLDATGFDWQDAAGAPRLGWDVTGYRVMAGGVDGAVVTRPLLEPTVTRALVTKRFAQLAGHHAVSRDRAVPDAERLLFQGVDLDLDTPPSGGFEAAALRLHLRLLGERPDADTLAADAALFTQISALSGVDQAWASLVAVLLQDPRFWTY